MTTTELFSRACGLKGQQPPAGSSWVLWGSRSSPPREAGAVPAQKGEKGRDGTASRSAEHTRWPAGATRSYCCLAFVRVHLCVVLGLELKASHGLDEHTSAELHIQPSFASHSLFPYA